MSTKPDKKPLVVPLESSMSWRPGDQAEVEQALLVAMDALDRRHASARELLEDPWVSGLIDPERLRAQMQSDCRATTVLRSLLTRSARPAS